MDQHSLKAHFEDLRVGLSPLRRLLGEDRERWFDEYMDHNEFGLALHVVCDSLLEEKELVVDDRTIEAIETLHEKMQLVDACGTQLRQRRCMRA
jgi:hypothetical protein